MLGTCTGACIDCVSPGISFPQNAEDWHGGLHCPIGEASPILEMLGTPVSGCWLLWH